MVTVYSATVHYVAWYIHPPILSGECGSLPSFNVYTCALMWRRAVWKGMVWFVRCGVGNLYYDVASLGEAQMPHTVRATVIFLYS
jgi:hypothetical protein